MNDYATGALLEPRRARIRIQIRTKPGDRDEIIFATTYNVSGVMDDGSFVLSYNDRNGNRIRKSLESGTYFETKLMG